MAEWRKQTDTERRTLADRLRQAREEAGLNQADVAERLGIASRSILSELEHGQRRLDVVELIALARLYGKDPSWFMRADGDGAVEGTSAHEGVHRRDGVPGADGAGR